MKIEIEVAGKRAAIQDGQWQGDPILLPRVLEADFKAGFVWDPIGGMDYAIAQVVAATLGGTVLTVLPKDKDDYFDKHDPDIIY